MLFKTMFGSANTQQKVKNKLISMLTFNS